MVSLEQIKDNKLALYGLTFLIAIIPAIYFYTSKVQEIKDQEVALTTEIQSSELILASQKKKQTALPELKGTLERKKQDLEKIEALLPNRVSVQKSLEIITRLSKLNNVTLKSFDQLPEILSMEQTYYQIPINISVTGTFKDLVLFYDQMAHTKQLIRLTNLHFSSNNIEQDELSSSCSVLLFRGI